MARRRDTRRERPPAPTAPAATPSRVVALGLPALPVIAILFVLAPYLWPLDRAPSSEFSDIHHAHLPFVQLLAEGWRRDGELPRWNVQDFAGLPTVGDPQAGTYNPIYWLLALAPTGHAFGVLIVAWAVAGALGFQLYARGLGLTPAGAAAGAVVFTLGGALLLRLVVPGHVVFASCFLLPLLLWILERIALAPRRTSIAAGACLTGLLAVSLAPQMLLYATALLAVLGAAIAARAPRRTPTLLAFALVAVLGAALAAVHLLPILALAGEFTRGHPAFASAARGLDEFAPSLAWLAGTVTGSTATPEVGLKWETHVYVGGVALCLAGIGLVAWPAGDPRRARAWLHGALVAGIVAFGLGPAAGLGPFRMPTRIFVLLALPLAVLVGLGVDALTKAPAGRRVIVRVALIAALAFDTGRVILPWVQTTPEDRLAAPARGVVLPPSLATATRVAELERGAVSPGLPEPLVRRRGLETLAGMNPLIPWRFALFASYAAGFEPFKYSFDIAVPLLAVEEPVLFDLMGVTHVLRPLSEKPPRWRWDERPTALPRAYLVPAPLVVPEGTTDDEIEREVEALARLVALDPRQAVLLHGAGAEDALARAGGRQDFEPFRPVAIAERRAHRIRLEVTLAAPGILVLNEPFFPGWRAWDAGVEIPIIRANGLFRALVLAPGNHPLTLEFAPRAWRIGRATSLAALVLTSALLVPWGRRAPRSP